MDLSIGARFRPAWWLPGPHAQTIGGRYLRGRIRIDLVRERLATPDRDFVDLDFAPHVRAGDEAPLVLILHGLEGSTRSGYMLAQYRALAEAGVRGIGLNFRSCSGEMNLQPRFYHAGDTADLALAVEHVRNRFPRAPLGAIGFSLGGNVLLKYLGERGGDAGLRAAAAISVPFDLAAGAEQLEAGAMARVYTHYFMRKLLRKSALRGDVLGDRCDVTRVAAARTLREFDEAATAPLHGFRDAAHYYEESSAARWLGPILVPTLLLHAVDDPFLPPPNVPRRAVEENPHLVEGFTSSGGHVGFVGGSPWRPLFWAELEAAQFVAARL